MEALTIETEVQMDEILHRISYRPTAQAVQFVMELDKYMADVGFTEQLIATLLAELLHQNKQDLAYFVEKSLEASFSEGGKVDKTGAWSESMTEFSEAVAGYENMLKIFNSISSLS